MRGCRQIYNNLLLLSVMFFPLSGAAHPWLHAGCSHDGCVFSAHADETCRRALYQDGCTFAGYAKMHFCGPVCGDTALVLPESTPFFAVVRRAADYGEPASRPAPARAGQHREPRGPPRGGSGTTLNLQDF